MARSIQLPPALLPHRRSNGTEPKGSNHRQKPGSWMLVPLLFLTNILLLPAQVPVWDTAVSIHSSGPEAGLAVTGDPVSGEVYIAGTWSEDLTATFPPNAKPSLDFSASYGAEDGFVSKWTRSGKLVWAFKIGSPGNDAIYGIKLDRKGNFYITGKTGTGTGHFEGTGSLTADSSLLNPAGADLFVASYDTTGRLRWIRQAISNNESCGNDLDLYGDQIFITGYGQGSIDFSGQALNLDGGDDDGLTACLSSKGDLEWLIHSGSNNTDRGSEIVADEQGIVVAGTFRGDSLPVTDVMARDTAFLVNSFTGKSDIFLAAYDHQGNLRWTDRIGSTDEDITGDLSRDGMQLYLTGGLHNNTTFPDYPGNPVKAFGGMDIFVAAFEHGTGKTSWVRVIECQGGGDEYGLGIASDGSDHLYLSGFYQVSIHFADTSLNNSGNTDGFLATWSLAGDFEYAKKIGSAGRDRVEAICINNYSQMIITGSYEQALTINGFNLPADGNRNIFFASLSVPCLPAEAGTLSGERAYSCSGQPFLFSLDNHSGSITWQKAPPGTNNWTDISLPGASPVFSCLVTEEADYRAFLSRGDCEKDSSNVLNLPVIPSPEASITGDITKCDDGVPFPVTVQFTGNAPWSVDILRDGLFYKGFSNQNSAEISFQVNSSGIYTLANLVDENCPGFVSGSSEIAFIEQPVANAGEDQEVCGLETLLGAATSAGTGSWSYPSGLNLDPGTDDPAARVTADDYGSYTLTWTEVNDICADSDQVEIGFFEPPVAQAMADQELEFLFETELQADPPDVGTGQWSLLDGKGKILDPGLTLTRVTGMGLGKNVFLWSVSNGPCPVATDEVVIRVRDLFVPNIMTPNGDSKNQQFYVKGLLHLETPRLTVFNRWGLVVYSTPAYLNNWEGTDQDGNPLQPDTYYYSFEFPSGRTKSGYIVIRR